MSKDKSSKKTTPVTGITKIKIGKVQGGRTNPSPSSPTFLKPPAKKTN